MQTVGIFQGSTCPVWSVPPTGPPNVLCMLPLHTFGIHCISVFLCPKPGLPAHEWHWFWSRHFYSPFFTSFSWLQGLSIVSPVIRSLCLLVLILDVICSYNSQLLHLVRQHCLCRLVQMSLPLPPFLVSRHCISLLASLNNRWRESVVDITLSVVWDVTDVFLNRRPNVTIRLRFKHFMLNILKASSST